jgi:hypothetical protein
MCSLAVATAVRGGGHVKPLAESEVDDAAQVVETSRRVHTLATRARLDQQLAELRALLELTTGVDEPCQGCDAIDARERRRALRARQEELIRERDRVRTSMPRKPPGVRISQACLVNPLAKDCM